MRSPHTTGYAALFRGFHAIQDENGMRKEKK